MKTAQSLVELRHMHGVTRVAAAFGAFDGLHWGHRVIIEHVLTHARDLHAMPVVITFEPHPRVVLSHTPPPPLLTPLPLKLALLNETGIEATVLLPFDREMAKLPADIFLREHVFTPDGPQVAAVCVGASWRFGRQGKGTVETLTSYASARNCIVDSIPEIQKDGRPVSSTRIRHAIQQGHLDAASRLLGRPVSVTGTVVRGKGIGGSHLDCPTANLATDRVPLPPDGVYAANCRLLRTHEELAGIAYVGTAPTLAAVNPPGEPPRVVEVHLFNMERNLYGETLEVQFMAFIRDDQRFESEGALKVQIQKDIEVAREILKQ